MTNNAVYKKPNVLSPTWTIVLAIVTLLGMYLLLPAGDSNFYITCFFMVLACLGVIGAAIATAGIKGYGYPKRMTLQVVAWRYFLTQFIVSVVFTLTPMLIGWGFHIEVKRYLITHAAVLALFGTAAVLLVTGKKQMDEAKLADLHNLCARVQALRDRVRASVAGKEQRVLAINELDELYAAISYANPVYSDSLAYIESENKKEVALLDECIDRLADDDELALDALARICKNIKAKIQEREEIIKKETEE